MKKIIFCFLFTAAVASCNNDADSTTATDSTQSPGAIEPGGTQHPNGVTGSSVTSTDTAAMNVERMMDTTLPQ